MVAAEATVMTTSSCGRNNPAAINEKITVVPIATALPEGNGLAAAGILAASPASDRASQQAAIAIVSEPACSIPAASAGTG